MFGTHTAVRGLRWGPEAAGRQEVNFGSEWERLPESENSPNAGAGRWWATHPWRRGKGQLAATWAHCS